MECLKNYAHILLPLLPVESLERAVAAASSYLTVGRGKNFVTSQKAFQAAKIQHFVKMSNETCHLSCRHWHLQPASHPASPAHPSQGASQATRQRLCVCLTHTHRERDTDTLCGWECIYPVRALLSVLTSVTLSANTFMPRTRSTTNNPHSLFRSFRLAFLLSRARSWDALPLPLTLLKCGANLFALQRSDETFSVVIFLSAQQQQKQQQQQQRSASKGTKARPHTHRHTVAAKTTHTHTHRQLCSQHSSSCVWVCYTRQGILN